MNPLPAPDMDPMWNVQDLINRYFPPIEHPYRQFERAIDSYITEGNVVLEVGCGRTAPMLSNYKNRGARLIGIDLVKFDADPELDLINANISDLSAITSSSVNLIYSRSMMEHVKDVEAAYKEIARVLKPGGAYIFLTPNLRDYASVIAHIVPNRLHGKIVKFTEGRDEIDTFPTYYRSNIESSIRQLAQHSHLRVKSLEFLGQYPSYFAFNRTLFRIISLYVKFLDRWHALRGLRSWIFCHLERPITDRS